MSLKGAMASFRSLRSEDVHVHQHGNSGIRSRERDIQPLDQCIDRNHRLAEQEAGEAPHCGILADTAFLEAFAPPVGYDSQLV